MAEEKKEEVLEEVLEDLEAEDAKTGRSTEYRLRRKRS